MTETTPGVPLGAWLAELDDERLIRLLELRPDLTQPPPGTIAALAARAQARQSVKAATDALDFMRLAVLDALLVLHADTAAVPLSKLLALIGDRASEDAVIAAVDDLRARALVWGDATMRVAAEAAAGLPWYPGQATVEDSEQTDIAARLDALDSAQLELLQRLLEGSPMGRTRDAAPGTPADRPVQRLLAARPAASGGHRNRDPAAAGRSGDARRAARTGSTDATRSDGIDHDRRRRRRGGRRGGDRSAA